ncbi:hypothetical protein [Novipirellula artificiosorum]|uniref:N-sulphoglucosamine sulphohydrolase C-terminal domain-containing protein n=1 Tax=Novipirellula artificiosorum TaxID=2528016 RepID=A0A5C6CVT3_9BACT|nr:hypothetical protein [Novipirellula artificiosorum]TWU29063.1 hypothetical protein Poly41_67620 [Novipirellula artificiosorum]
MLRPPEQLYLTTDDPYEMKNLADDPKFAETKSRLSDALDEWMESQSDPGAPVDTVEALRASRRGQHLHGLAK